MMTMTENERAKTLSIIQSNYIPWKGYFDMIRQSDVLVLFDNVQSTKNDWRNRNRIKSANGEVWLTIPIHHSLGKRISEVTVADRKWARRHFRTIEQSYTRAPYMAKYRDWLYDLYNRAAELQTLSSINRLFLYAILEKLKIETQVVEAADVLPVEELDALSPTARLVAIARKLRGRTYISGPAAQSYLDEISFREAGISVTWMRYEGFPQYPQLHGQFRHDVSVIDLLLMTGPEAQRYLDRVDPVDSMNE
ncbi:WbqC family protein [Dongia soli]|uniref:WbqC family protein n=1 Tax=Dongia soli TaxID=600628 RepID=A0ABU5ED07_9PROT|nr:WbqC family protein [Dongia soli]MDY0884066.1 WbqC family protein [Dongia soli]